MTSRVLGARAAADSRQDQHQKERDSADLFCLNHVEVRVCIRIALTSIFGHCSCSRRNVCPSIGVPRGILVDQSAVTKSSLSTWLADASHYWTLVGTRRWWLWLNARSDVPPTPPKLKMGGSILHRITGLVGVWPNSGARQALLKSHWSTIIIIYASSTNSSRNPMFVLKRR